MLNDSEIEYLNNVPKYYLGGESLKWKIKDKSRKLDVPVSSEDGQHAFIIYFRQCEKHENNFSCGVRLVRSGKDDITLVRYNGSSHVHVNFIEKDKMEFKCHIHLAAERYWAIGRKLEDYAVSTERYQNLAGAIQCLLVDYKIESLNIGQLIKQGGLLDEN